LWCKEKFSGDLRFVFRAKAESDNLSIFYFNANPTKNSGYDGIFDWIRPDAQMARYAGNAILEMYSMGILRDAEECNFRYIGGGTAALYNSPNRKVDRAHQKATLIRAYSSLFREKADTWFTFDVQTTGNRITLKVDGKEIFSVEDTGKAEPGVFSRSPLANGGFFGFRNFRPSAVCIDYIKIYRRP
ncbi:family 16 glycoside hydrolase, partial [Candidatus Hydrogenedentota bacterium]